MNSLPVLIAALALLFPAAVTDLTGSAPPEREPEAGRAYEAVTSGLPLAADNAAPAPFRVLDEARKPPVERQVRIEQRVIIRIAPSSPRTVAQSMAQIAENADKFDEERFGNCIPISSLAAVQPADDNRLILFTRDRRVLSAALEKSCNPEDFYLGFYVERSSDGQLCSHRDKLQSRSGASCRFTRLSRLIEPKD